MNGALKKISKSFRIVTILTVGTSLSASSCIPDTGKLINPGVAAVQQASDQIDIAVAKLQQESANWQQVLTDLQSKVTGDAKKLIDNDVQNLLTRTVNHAGVEFRCDGDFINRRVAEALIAIKAKIMGKPIPALEPQFCSAIPEAVDMKLVPNDVNLVTFYGFNFDNNGGYRLALEDLNGTTRDVTRAISIPTAYAMTLALGPSGAMLNSTSARLQLYWKDKLVSTVSVIQPQQVVNICKSTVVSTDPQLIGPYIPPRVAGDKDFAGNGPTIWAAGNLTNTPVDVTLHLQFRAKETKSDWTEVSGMMDSVIYRAPAGKRIDKIVGPTSTSFGPVTEGNEHWLPAKIFDLGSGGLITRLEIIGDTGGDDAGVTQIQKAMIRPIQLVVSETGNCVPPTALGALIGTRFLSEGVKTAISAKVTAERNRLNQLATHVVMH